MKNDYILSVSDPTLMGVEPLHTVREVARALRISYDSALRLFRDVPGVLTFYRPKRYKRPYKQIKIPHSVFLREWQKLTNAKVGE
jgi:hypothetical protein